MPFAELSTRYQFFAGNRGVGKTPFINRVADELAPPCARVPWLANAPVGSDALQQLARR